MPQAQRSAPMFTSSASPKSPKRSTPLPPTFIPTANATAVMNAAVISQRTIAASV
jgi:hypothetical protein